MAYRRFQHGSLFGGGPDGGLPMSRRPRIQPKSLPQAMEMCLERARVAQNRSVDNVADLMGLPNKWSIYKWLSNGRMPTILIRPFEHACGAHYLTEYLAASANKLLVDMPRGAKASDAEINQLQSDFVNAIGLLIDCYSGAADVDETLSALITVLKGVAWHDKNVRKQFAPELDIFPEGRA